MVNQSYAKPKLKLRYQTVYKKDTRLVNQFIVHNFDLQHLLVGSLSDNEMSIYTALGVVEDIIQIQNAYHKLTVCINSPFKTEFLTLKVESTKLLRKYENEMFQKGDGVMVEYQHNNSTPYLNKLYPASIDNCPVCYNALEASDAQRSDCDGCSIYTWDERKIRINKAMKVLSVSKELYPHSSGIRVELLSQNESNPLIAIIFPNEQNYSSASKFKVGDIYNILGWKSGDFIDIIDVCW